jgi:hypothetical protein
VPYIIFLRALARNHDPGSWPALVVEMAGSGLVYLGLSWLVVLKQSERLVWVGRVRDMLGGGLRPVAATRG